jgi:hypothetical protein
MHIIIHLTSKVSHVWLFPQYFNITTPCCVSLYLKGSGKRAKLQFYWFLSNVTIQNPTQPSHGIYQRICVSKLWAKRAKLLLRPIFSQNDRNGTWALNPLFASHWNFSRIIRLAVKYLKIWLKIWSTLLTIILW